MLTKEAEAMWVGIFWACVGECDALVRHTADNGKEFAVFEFATLDKGYSVFADANAMWLDAKLYGNKWYSIRVLNGKLCRAVSVDEVMSNQEWMATFNEIIELSRAMSGDDCPDSNILIDEKQCWRGVAWITYLSDWVREKLPEFPIDKIEYKWSPSEAYSTFRMWAEMVCGVCLTEQWRDDGVFIDIDGLMGE